MAIWGAGGGLTPQRAASEARMRAFYSYQKPRAARPAKRAPVQGEPGYTGAHKTYGRGLTKPVKKKKKPKFGEVGTLTREQSAILKQMMGEQAPTYAPVSAGGAAAGGWAGGMPGYAPITMQAPQRAQIAQQAMPGYEAIGIPAPAVPEIPQYAMPGYAPVGLAGAGERQAALSRMMAASPEEEAAAIQRMSAPAMRQFREEILPGIRGGAAATGTTWSTMRAGEEAKAGAGLAESLAAMGEQHRMARRGQAMQAAGLGTQEAIGAAQLGVSRYGMEMQPALQAQRAAQQAALQQPQIAAQLGIAGTQAGLTRYGQAMQPALQAQRYTAEAALQQPQLAAQLQQAGVQAGLGRYGTAMGGYMQAQQLGMQPALQAQQLTASAAERRRAMLAQMMGIPMMSIYSY